MEPKKYPKIAFINLTKEIRTIGVQNVFTYLEKQGFDEIYLIHFFAKFGEGQLVDQRFDQLVSLINKLQPDILAFSLMSTSFRLASFLCRKLKHIFPEKMIIWGGIHPTLMPEESIEFCDCLCRGEAEEASFEFFRAIKENADYSQVANFWVRKEGSVIKNPLRPLLENLDSRPFPSINFDKTYCFHEGQFSKLNTRLYRKYSVMQATFYDIMASRGCPYVCSYCSNSALNKLYPKGKVLRLRSVDNILEELLCVKKRFPFTRGFNFQDDAFGAAPDEFLKEFSEKYKKEINLPFQIRIIPGMITENKIRILKDASLASAVLGLQGSDRVNKEIFKRNCTKEKFLEIARLLRKYQVAGRYDLIVENNFNNEEDELEVIETLAKTPKPFVLLEFPLAFLPKTELSQMAQDNNMIKNNYAYYSSETGFGNSGEKFPLLAKIRAMAPYTPSSIIRFFLKFYTREWCATLIKFYFYTIFLLEQKFIIFLVGHYQITYLTQKFLMRITRNK